MNAAPRVDEHRESADLLLGRVALGDAVVDEANGREVVLVDLLEEVGLWRRGDGYRVEDGLLVWAVDEVSDQAVVVQIGAAPGAE